MRYACKRNPRPDVIEGQRTESFASGLYFHSHHCSRELVGFFFKWTDSRIFELDQKKKNESLVRATGFVVNHYPSIIYPFRGILCGIRRCGDFPRHIIKLSTSPRSILHRFIFFLRYEPFPLPNYSNISGPPSAFRLRS